MSRHRAPAGHRAFALALLLCPAPGCGDGVAAPEPDDFAVLFVGNSLTYANGLPHMLQQLFVLAGEESPVVGEEAFPNFGLEDHWVTGARERIAQGGWDVVVLQQGPSATEGRPSLLEYSRLFAEDIRAAGGEPALYMVWPAATRSFDFAGVSDSYATAADLVDGLLFPVGEAWLAAWRVDPEMELYGPDGFHPSLTGTYLAALVMYQQLSGNDPRLLPAVIPGPSGAVDIGAERAGLLQQAAFEANAEFAR